ncbi:MAG: phospholipid carrier-dependent glycosyltransferase [Planctomycetaceae bacterium]|nr:phospholipid carrier-dependent glycosyltransferase [Planctomycetaceae bacterium]
MSHHDSATDCPPEGRSGADHRHASGLGPLLWLLLTLGLMARLFAAIAVEQYVTAADRQFLIEGDANGYWELAGNLASGRDYAIHTPPRYVLRTPGFPLLLAACRMLGGDSVLTARCVLAMVGTFCCLLTFLLAKRMFGQRVALLATAWVALHPVHIGNSVLILSETWFACWMLLSLLTLQQLWTLVRKTGSTRRLTFWGLMAGVSIAVAMLVRPGFLLWLPVTACAIALPLLRGRLWQRRLQTGALTVISILVGFAVVVSPWAIRNQRVTGHLVLTSLWSGPSLYDGLNPDANGRSDMTFFDTDQVMNDMSEFEMNEHYKRKAFNFAVTHPGQAARLAFPKAYQFLQPVPNSLADKGWAIWAGCTTLWCTLMGGVLLAVGIGRTRWPQLLLTAGPLCLFLTVHMVFVGSVRYRLPLEFPLTILSAYGWLALAMPQMRQQKTAGQDDLPVT